MLSCSDRQPLCCRFVLTQSVFMPTVVTPLPQRAKCACAPFVQVCTIVLACICVCPGAYHYTALVSHQNTGDLPDVIRVLMSYKAALSATGPLCCISGPIISLSVRSGCCFLTFQVLEQLAKMVSGGRPIIPRLTPCRISLTGDQATSVWVRRTVGSEG